MSQNTTTANYARTYWRMRRQLWRKTHKPMLRLEMRAAAQHYAYNRWKINLDFTAP